MKEVLFFFIFALLDEVFFGRGWGRHVKVGDLCIALFFKSEG